MRILTLSLPILLAGCATNATVPNIPSNVVLSAPGAYNEQYIESVKFDIGISHKQSSPAKCLALVVNNSEHTLTDSSNSFVGAYTGNYYNIEKSRQVGGGQSLLYSDETSAIAKGNTKGTFTFGLVPITKIVTFKIEVNATPENRFIKFTDVQAAQESTGAANNTGFSKAGAWSGAEPVFVYNLLNKVSDDIKSCMSGS
ncbi:hypothetical protein SAMN05216317_1378 [Nitrosomonas eutropha]|uniref:hypothetical protein n=1 Tax=Nitrosomonas eutropha TaxID=916 RepID=UPI0008971C04|nr:hypothetical protein [Nitrosomonas eutropha]SDX12667.1 hypothetical protein SAMN05216317_1378 [Nitrosomonas eutropha]